MPPRNGYARSTTVASERARELESRIVAQPGKTRNTPPCAKRCIDAWPRVGLFAQPQLTREGPYTRRPRQLTPPGPAYLQVAEFATVSPGS
jgi:hypothetical protein